MITPIYAYVFSRMFPLYIATSRKIEQYIQDGTVMFSKPSPGYSSAPFLGVAEKIFGVQHGQVGVWANGLHRFTKLKKVEIWDDSSYPLVNIQKTMENQHF